MTASLNGRFVQWILAGSLLLLLANIAAAIAAHPAVITAETGQAASYLLLLAAAVAAYGAVIFLVTRPDASGLREGLWCGLACGAAWTLELLVANVVRPPTALPASWLYAAAYSGTTAAAGLMPALAGLVAARRAGSVTAGLRAGLLCGMCGALMIFLASFALSAVLIPAGYQDPQTVQEFTRSGLPDLTTYIVSDYLAGMIWHLWIGLVSGLVLGIVGSLLGKAVSQQAG